MLIHLESMNIFQIKVKIIRSANLHIKAILRKYNNHCESKTKPQARIHIDLAINVSEIIVL